MSYRQGEVLGRIERRRRFSLEQKVAVLAEAYERQQRKMIGVETLLAGALLVLAIRVAKVHLPAGIQIDFFRVNSAAKGMLSNMLAGLKS